MLGWERQGFPLKILHDQIKAIADDNNPYQLRLTLLRTLQQSIEGY